MVIYVNRYCRLLKGSGGAAALALRAACSGIKIQDYTHPPMPDDKFDTAEGGVKDSESDFGDPGGLTERVASTVGGEDSRDEDGFEDEEDSDTEDARPTHIKAFERSLATLKEKNKKQMLQTLSPDAPTNFHKEWKEGGFQGVPGSHQPHGEGHTGRIPVDASGNSSG